MDIGFGIYVNVLNSRYSQTQSFYDWIQNFVNLAWFDSIKNKRH